MNEVIRQLNARKSVRAYTEQEIGKAEKEATAREILEHALAIVASRDTFTHKLDGN